MDIYAVEQQEGCYLANELEKLRKKRILAAPYAYKKNWINWYGIDA